MKRFAVIDTETTWDDEVMSVGIVIADSVSFELIDSRYYILTPYNHQGGMYSHALYSNGLKPHAECPRREAMDKAREFLSHHGIQAMFAYNAAFDCRHLPELHHLAWYDIMKVAAYRQHNLRISATADCCQTGRLRRDFGVESIYRLLSRDPSYCERHNALTDAIDELAILRLLGHPLDKYALARIH